MISPDDTQQLLQAGSARALADAAAFIRRRLSADGSSDGPDGDYAAPERQWAALLDWARDGQKNLPLGFPSPEREGGREHDVTLHELYIVDAIGRVANPRITVALRLLHQSRAPKAARADKLTAVVGNTTVGASDGRST
jgi:hypothetical protein